ncbi:MAG: galactokinase [Bacteroidales bacterium]|nr:galactokinase [Bacteroidales bacterium]MCF8455981.1 galactokinase [Bacteroidales bacterium]
MPLIIRNEAKPMVVEKISGKFKNLFETEPRLFQSPGRINLIGEHTDYNEGFVLPAAIDKTIVAAINLNSKKMFRFYSFDYEEYFEIKISEIEIQDTLWANYLLGVIAQFQKNGLAVAGIDCVFGGDIPIGAGLSSSAALECAIAYGINELFNFKLSKMQLVKMAQKAEHEYAGVNCGIMDQFASVFGLDKQVVKLDCRSLEHSYFPLDLQDYSIVLCDTKVIHSLASTKYNTRRMECEEGVRILIQFAPEINSLRDVDMDLLLEHKSELEPVVFKRCKYIIEENRRVNETCLALEKNDFELFGNLLYASHEGLKNEYQVSCKELDILVDFTKSRKDVLGARMMGGGFGGCTINLVSKSSEEEFIAAIAKDYLKRTNIILEVYKIEVSKGTSEIS